MRPLVIEALVALAAAGCGGPTGPALSLEARPADVRIGDRVELSWRSLRTTACLARGDWSGPKPTSGNESTAPLSSAAGFALTCRGPDGSIRANVTIGTGTVASSTAFPLHTEAGQRYLMDAAGRPFLIQGDAAWSLIAQPTRAEVVAYLDKRRAQGFNTLLVNLIEHRFASQAPRNAYGQAPFLTPGDFATPNEAYFAHADWVLGEAARRGFLVLLAPAYLGYAGTDHGWYREMKANGAAKLREYGRYLGRRYGGLPNIIWVNAGDFDPPERSLVEAVAEGIREEDPHALQTAHCAPDTAAIAFWGTEPWLSVNTIYTHNPVFAAAELQYLHSPQMPFFLIESAYENEHEISTVRVRTEAYQALLSGAAGQVFGNNPVWNFNGRPLFATPLKWQQQLDSPGAQSMAHLRTLFDAVKWWTLVPDIPASLVTSGLGDGQDRVVAALAADRTFALVYVPSARRITIDLSRFAGPSVEARWYEPASGLYQAAGQSPYRAVGERSFRPPRSFRTAGDWVLVLDSAGGKANASTS